MTKETTIDIILRTKLHRPPVPGDHVHRPRLFEYLDQRHERPLALVSAPAGYGKSVLISSWLEVSDRPSAWLSLDEQDSDLRQFLSYFLAAVQTMFSDAVGETISLANASTLPPVTALARSLSNELDSIEQNFILVLDDLHRIQGTSVYDLLNELLRYPPRSMHLVVISRIDPNLPISSLRARQQLSEVRLFDLCFSIEETAEYLQAMLGDQIKDDTAAKIANITEGWIVGLRLAALAIRGQKDTIGKLLERKGNTAHMSEYLITEVLDAQLPVVHHNLLITSILDRFSAPLCDSLSVQDSGQIQGEIDGADFIAKLQNENLFLIALDTENRWFRYHHLFQNLLHNQLKRNLSFKEIASLHKRASDWFEAEGLIEEALKHALAAEDVDRAIGLVERHCREEISSDRWYVVEAWLQKVPKAEKKKRASLLLAQAWVFYQQVRLAEMAELASRARILLPECGLEERSWFEGEINLIQAIMAYWQGDFKRTLEFTQKSEHQLNPAFLFARADREVYWGLGMQMDGRGDEALDEFKRRLRDEPCADPMLVTRRAITSAFIHLLCGRTAQVRQFGVVIWELAEKHEMAYTSAWSSYNRGCACFQRGDFEKAYLHLGKVAEKRHLFHRQGALSGIAALALTCEALGRADEADAALDLLLDYAREHGEPASLAVAESCRSRVRLCRSGLPPEPVAEAGGAPDMAGMIFFMEIPYITECRILIASDQMQQVQRATRRLAELRVELERRHNTFHLIDVLVLQAVASARQGDESGAAEVLAEAVEMALPGWWCRPFIEAGDSIKDVLERIPITHENSEMVRHLKQRLGTGNMPERSSPATQSLIAPLTHRELDVLDLLAQRLQNQEIASKLFVSLETVKTHLKNIYQKLNVSKRHEAVSKAMDLGIITRR